MPVCLPWLWWPTRTTTRTARPSAGPACVDAAFAIGAAAEGPAFRRLLHGAIPESVFSRWNAQRAQLGLPVFDPGAMGTSLPGRHVLPASPL